MQRSYALLALTLGFVACDQGHTAPSKEASAVGTSNVVAAVTPLPVLSPRPAEVRDDEEFLRRASVVIDELIVAMTPPNGDCEQAARQIVAYVDKERMEIAVLTRYSDTHKPLSERVTKEFQPKIEKLMPAITKCGPNGTYMKAIQRLSEDKWYGLVRNDDAR